MENFNHDWIYGFTTGIIVTCALFLLSGIVLLLGAIAGLIKYQQPEKPK